MRSDYLRNYQSPLIDSSNALAFFLVKSPFEPVADAARAILEKWWNKGIAELSISDTHGPIRLLTLEKFYNPKKKIVLIQSIINKNFEFTIIDSNLCDGYHSLGTIISKSLNDQHFMYIRSFDKPSPVHEMSILLNGKIIRLVRVIRESDGYQFYQRGELAPFEENFSYANRKIENRVNRDLLIRYLDKLGISEEVLERNDLSRRVVFSEV